MAVNKVVMNTENGAETLIDLTDDTVTAETLAEGVTAHDASGTQITGTMTAGTGSGSANAVLYTAQTLTDEQKTQARTNIGAISNEDMDAFSNEAATAFGSAITGTQPGVLKWNGIIGNRAYVDIDGICLVHVTDEVPTIMAELPIATIGMTQFFECFFSAGMPAEIMPMTEDGAYMCGEAVLIIPYDNYPSPFGTLPKKGVYFMAMSGIAYGIDMSEMYVSSLLIPGYAFAESGGGGCDELLEERMEYVGDTITWDGVVGDRPFASTEFNMGGNIYRITAVLVSESTPSVDLLNSAGCIVTTSVNGTNNVSNVTFSMDASGMWAKTDMGVNITYADGVEVDGIVLPKAGVYFASQVNGANKFFTTSMTCPGVNFLAQKKVIKEEYLPGNLGSGVKEVTYYAGEGTGASNTFYIYKTSDTSNVATRVTHDDIRYAIQNGTNILVKHEGFLGSDDNLVLTFRNLLIAEGNGIFNLTATIPALGQALVITYLSAEVTE